MTKQPEALRLAHIFEHPLPPEWSDMVAATKELRRQHTEIETLRTGYDAARLEIASLHTQMEAVGAGGMEPLRKRCLHQISEPANEGWCDGCSPDNCGGCVTPASPAQTGEYPELPEPTVHEDEVWRIEYFTESQMHAYVDADRAARVVAQAAPVEAENEIDLLAEAALCERLDACLAAARAAQGIK